jgi:hypothetical protein
MGFSLELQWVAHHRRILEADTSLSCTMILKNEMHENIGNLIHLGQKSRWSQPKYLLFFINFQA